MSTVLKISALFSTGSFTFMTLTSLLSCFVICSTMRSSPVVTIVMRDTNGSVVSATQRLSMLNPLPEKSPAILARTPNSFDTKTDIVCLTDNSFSQEKHFIQRLSGRNHRVNALRGVNHKIHENGPVLYLKRFLD